MTDTELVRELAAVGLHCGIREGAIVTWHSPEEPSTADRQLADFIMAAHGKPTCDPAVIDLRTLLGPTSDEWAAYVACRNRQTRNERRERYTMEADPLVLRALETAMVTQSGVNYELNVPIEDWDAWLAAKAAIRTELPYPIEE